MGYIQCRVVAGRDKDLILNSNKIPNICLRFEGTSCVSDQSYSSTGGEYSAAVKPTISFNMCG